MNGKSIEFFFNDYELFYYEINSHFVASPFDTPIHSLMLHLRPLKQLTVWAVILKPAKPKHNLNFKFFYQIIYAHFTIFTDLSQNSLFSCYTVRFKL